MTFTVLRESSSLMKKATQKEKCIKTLSQIYSTVPCKLEIYLGEKGFMYGTTEKVKLSRKSNHVQRCP